MTTTQWYDPQLKIAIREELPGGYFRELRDIRVGAQSPQLFTIPAGYQLTKAPQKSQSAPADARQQGAPGQQAPQRAVPQQAPAQQRVPSPPQQYPAQPYPRR